MSQLNILFVGEADRSEFRQASRELADLGCVISTAEDQAAVDLIVVAQSYPGQFSHQAVDRLRRLSPLAPVLGLMGSWCEGEMRTGKPWPGAVRVYWHQWVCRCRWELDLLQRGQITTWALPATAAEEERLLMPIEDVPAPNQGLVAIHTPHYGMEDWLSAALRGRGCSTVWLRPPRPARLEGAVAAVFDGTDCRGEQLEQLEHLVQSIHPAPVLVLLDFPRIEDHRRAIAAGAAAVLSKPLHVNDLFRQWQRVQTP